MATTPAGVCNIALLRVGQKQLVDDLDENTTQARICKAFYADARNAVLASFPWKFATRRASLAVLTGNTRSGWLFVYGVPADCINPRRIWDGVRNAPADSRIPFDIEGDATSGRVLLTDEEDAELIYTARIESVTLFSPLFVDALAWRLASDLALSLPVKPQVGLAMANGFKQALRDAGAAELRQAQEDLPPESESIRVRG